MEKVLRSGNAIGVLIVCTERGRHCEKTAKYLERETGFEPATLALARRCSTTELFPLDHNWLEGWDSTDARTKLSSNQVGPAHHCYLVTFVTIFQPCYQVVTHEYYYQVFDLLYIYFMKVCVHIANDTTYTHDMYPDHFRRSD